MPKLAAALFALAAVAFAPLAGASDKPPTDSPHANGNPPKAEWYEKIHIRGYTQVRYNRLLETNDKFVNEQADKSIGGDGGFFIRRARLILYGDVHERVFIYLQPDFANLISENTHVAALRDWYADLALDKDRTARFRVGQSKVPYGFENMQSSQNRLPFDRSDAVNSAVANERDLGVFFYWAPKEIRRRFKHLVDSGLKGSGDYGLVALGAYNGQTANKPEMNDQPHLIWRVTYPFQLGKQFVEASVGGYAGKYVVNRDKEKVKGGDQFRDIRAHATFVLYPQPFGFQVEYNVGVGPELDVASKTIREQRLHGGYAMVMYRARTTAGDLFPYVRGVYYDGGKKHEKNAPSYHVKEVESGLEWQPHKNLEIVVAYLFGERTNPATNTQENGRLLRVQVQFNY